MAYVEVIDKMENRFMICMKQSSETKDDYAKIHTRKTEEEMANKTWPKKM